MAMSVILPHFTFDGNQEFPLDLTWKKTSMVSGGQSPQRNTGDVLNLNVGIKCFGFEEDEGAMEEVDDDDLPILEKQIPFQTAQQLEQNSSDDDEGSLIDPHGYLQDWFQPQEINGVPGDLNFPNGSSYMFMISDTLTGKKVNYVNEVIEDVNDSPQYGQNADNESEIEEWDEELQELLVPEIVLDVDERDIDLSEFLPHHANATSPLELNDLPPLTPYYQETPSHPALTALRNTPKRSKSVTASPTRKTYPCKICARPFSSSASAGLHVRTHLNREELLASTFIHDECPHCQQIFFSKFSFHQHLSSHEGQKTHSCPICNKSFASKVTLKNHSFVHLTSEEKAKVEESWLYSCQFCQKRFKTRSTLQRHLLVHTKENKQFPCDECGIQFKTMEDQIEHIAAHLNLKKSATEPTLDKENLKPLTLKDVCCPQCDKTFTTQAEMEIHLKGIHLGVRYLCPYCDKTFVRKNGLVSHIKRAHPSETPPAENKTPPSKRARLEA